MADRLLQSPHSRKISRRYEGNDHSVGASSAGSPGSVQVVLGRRWQVEMNDAAHAFDMDAPGCHVGGDKRLGPPRGKRPQGLLALGLGSAAMEGDGLNTGRD